MGKFILLTMPTHVYLQLGDLNVYDQYDLPPVSDREAVRKQIERFREKDERDEFLRQRQFAIDIRKAAYASAMPGCLEHRILIL